MYNKGMNEDTILHVEKASLAFGKEVVFNNVSFSLKKGEVLAIVGPNGAGKTMLLKSLLGLVSYSGSIRWKKDIKIGYVPQHVAIDFALPLTVKEFFALRAKRFWFTEKKFVSHLDHELKAVGLSHEFLERPLSELSSGQLQRVLIAWSLVGHPDVLLFDEPTSGIDVGGEETIYSLLHHLQDEWNIAIIIVSHDLHVVYHYANDVLCLNKEMVCHGAPYDVLTQEQLKKLYGEVSFYHHLKHTQS